MGQTHLTTNRICVSRRLSAATTEHHLLNEANLKPYRRSLLTSLIAFGLLTPLPLGAQTGSPALREVVKSPVQECKNDTQTELPIITWGGDVATILANGDQRQTGKDSIFAKAGQRFKLFREDNFAKQIEAYLSCKTPYLRGTAGMINMASEAISADPRTAPKIVYQLTWSAGGDAIIVKEGIKSPKDLKGKIVALQAYGPHVDYLTKILADAGLAAGDVKVVWTKDLTGSGSTPAAAFARPEVHAAMVIIPDALAATSGGTVGTGAEDSVKGATIMLSTKSANRIIADVYAVRSDYFEKNRPAVESFVKGLLTAQEELKGLLKDRQSRKQQLDRLLAASGELLLDSPQATKDVEGMIADAEFAGYSGNVDFFSNASYPRSFEKVTGEIQPAFIALGLISKPVALAGAGWDFNRLGEGLAKKAPAESQRFDSSEVAKVVSKKQQQGTLDQGGLFSFEVYFKPNQTDFSADLYKDAFDKAIQLAATYGGSIITVEGHSDPLGYLKGRKANNPDSVLKQIRQSAKNLALSRANGVRDSLVSYAKSKGMALDPSQFAVVGHGIDKPKTGLCGLDPCAPRTEQEWLDNMRVEFRIIQVEAESSVFKPL